LRSTTGQCTPCPGEEEEHYYSERRYRDDDAGNFSPFLALNGGMRCLLEWNDQTNGGIGVEGAPNVALVGPLHASCELDGGCSAPWCDKVSVSIDGYRYIYR
jgi:hypothetical protein